MKKTYIIKKNDWFNKRNLPKNFVDYCSHSGDCERDIKDFAHRFQINNYSEIRDFLKTFGLDGIDEKSEEDILLFTLWIIACDVQERGFCYIGE